MALSAYVISDCCALSNTEYLHRHNLVARILHQELAQKYGLTERKLQYYKYLPEAALENDCARLHWDQPIITDRTILANKPDIVLMDRPQSRLLLVDINIPFDEDLVKAETEKTRKYYLAHVVADMWGRVSTEIIPVVVSLNGQHPKEVSAVKLKKKWICKKCGKGFKAPSQLKIHSAKHSLERNFYCVECDKSFKTDNGLKQHLKIATPHVNYKDLPLTCSHCNKKFAIRRDLERHINRIHLNVRPFKCDECDKAYLNSWGLKKHKAETHEGYKRPFKFPCPMCDKVFNRQYILKGHIRTHTGERPYQCTKCPATFSQAGILNTHMKLIHLKLTRDGKPKTTAK